MLYQQIIGRGLRKAEGKADCLVLDHSDTTLRLGFITDIEWGPLDDGQPNATNKRGRVSSDNQDETPASIRMRRWAAGGRA